MTFFPDSLNSIESFVWQLPGFFMIKDSDSRIVMTNKIGANLLGYMKIEEIAGTFDKDSKCEDVARISTQLIHEDKLTLTDSNGLNILYITKFYDQQFHALHASKKKIDLNGEPYILCSGHFINANISSQIARNFEKLNESVILKNNIKTNCYYIDKNIDHEIELSRQQMLILFYLLRGRSFKEIAKLMSLSHRTIESYIENVKHKFKCQSKSQLIEKAIDLGYLYCLPLEILNLNSQTHLP